MFKCGVVFCLLFMSWSSLLAVESSMARKQELVDRQHAIAGEIARLKDRLKTVPSETKMTELHQKLEEIYKNYGWEPQGNMVYGRRSIEPMLKKQNTVPQKLLKAFVQFNRDLKARDIDLIIVPLVPTPHFHAHTLVEGIGPENEYFSGWTEMMIEMLEQDLEIVDTVSEFRAEAENDVLVSWANDFHTGSLGRQIAAKKVAERLQRYEFAREMATHRSKFTVEVHERKKASWPQRIAVVNGAMESEKSYRKRTKESAWPDSVRRWKGYKRAWALNPKAPTAMADGMLNRNFKYMKVTGPLRDSKYARSEVVLVGDSQLHSAVFGSGLPDFYMAEIGGGLRWKSKSWSGFSPPDLYQSLIAKSPVAPRVVVLSFLPKYFWHHYHGRGAQAGQVNESANKCGPRPLPPVAGASAKVAALSELKATVRITKTSKKPTENASSLDYDDALMQVAAVVQDGPMQGKEISLRYWILHKGEWTKADNNVKVGRTMSLQLKGWQQIVDKDKRLGQHQIFDDTGHDLLVPVYWVIGGVLSPAQVIR